jgi:hypothetical protein
MTGATSMLWHPIYRPRMQVMLQGACGDALTGAHLSLPLLASPGRAAVIRRLFAEQSMQDESTLALIFAPAFLKRAWDERFERFAATFDGIDADQPAAIASAWDMENRQRRGALSTFAVERWFCSVRAPFLDGALADHLASIPARWRFQQRIYKRMIVRRHRHAAHVPWAYTGVPIGDNPAVEIARAAARFLARRIDPRSRHTPHYAFRDDVSTYRRDPEASAAIASWIARGPFDPDVFDARGIGELIRGFLASERGTERWLVPYANLCAIARAHVWFLSGSIPKIPPGANPALFTGP